MTSIALGEQTESIERAEPAPQEPLILRAIRNRRIGGFVFDTLYAYESLKAKIIRASAVTLGGVGVTAFMTGLAEKGSAAADTATGAMVATLLDNPELATPTDAPANANSLLAAGAAAIVAAGFINMVEVGKIDPATDCGLGVINPHRDLSETYKPSLTERFDAWAEVKREEFAQWRVATYAKFRAWRAEIAERRAAQINPDNSHYEPFATYHNTIGEPLLPVDELAF